jgi:hypothetical protein
VTAPTTHRATLDNGPLVVDGDLQWLSATIITKGDERAEGGCLRRLWYYAVEGRDEPGSASQGVGLKVHDEIERNITTGEMTLGPIALTAKAQIPKPGPGLLVEHALERGLITCAGVPVVGHIDLVSFRGVNVGASDFGDVQDPPGTIEIRDWKTSSDFRYAKTGDELRENVQMLTYGRYGLARWDPTFVRLTHVYIHTKKRSLPAINRSTGPMRPDEILGGWESVEAVGRKIRHVVRADRAEDVDANTRACGAFRGCPHRSYCRAANHDSLSSMWGEDVAAAFESLIIDESGEAAQTAAPSAPEGENPMSLLNLLNSDAIEAAPDPVAAKKAAMLAEIAKIEAEEAAAEAARKAKAAAKVEVPAGFAEALDTISRSYHDGKLIGFPPIGGEAAKVYAAAKGLALEGEGYAGSGALGGTPLITDPAKIIELAKRCEAQGKVQAKAADAPLGIVPPDAPESDPAKASAGPKTVAPAADPDVAVSQIANAAAASATAGVGGGTVTEGVAEKPKRGRPPGKKNTDKPADGATQTGPAAPDSEAADRLVVFVDAIPSRDYASLDGWFRELRATLCRNEGPTCVDPRLVPDSSGLAFGRWKGAISALARAKPPAPDIYVVIRPDELMSAALEGLREVADLFVVGVR